HISVHSEPGEGTTFELFLPLSREAEIAAEALSADSPEPSALRTGTVLLAEDEESVRKVIHEILRSQGYSVLVAEDGHDALRVAEKHEGEIDLLLTDVMMPRIKGPELAERLSRDRPDMAVLFMSGYHEDSVLGVRQRQGGAHLLLKPFTARQLGERVRELLEARGRRPLRSVAEGSAAEGLG
ncbi:MAG: response regulator, partial [Holophagales bacterium]|nr:response regulator [Holophagales bacterium]